jgi:hypothetical protein
MFDDLRIIKDYQYDSNFFQKQLAEHLVDLYPIEPI